MMSYPSIIRWLVCGVGILGASVLHAAGWTLVWSDEFSQPDGSTPDAANWNYDIGGGGWGNNELQYYTARTNNVRIANGQLVIEARSESFGGRNYTSARLLTKGKREWAFGRMEARIKIPGGQGIWPAFWMLGANIDSVPWPNCGEIDIMENIGREPTIVHGTIHGPGYSGANGIGGDFTLPGGGAYSNDFHIYTVEWETNRIRWFMDGQLFFTTSSTNLPNGSQWVFNSPQFILLNLAVGGNWPGNPNETTTFPQRMLVDYVRVYQLTNDPPCGGNVLANPGFEAGGLTGWTPYGAGFNTLIQNTTTHAGSSGFKVFGRFNGSENYSGIFQDLPAAQGAVYTGNAWAMTLGNDRIAGANAAWAEVSFRDSATNILALYRSAIMTSATPADTWRNLLVTNQLNPSTFATIGFVSNLVAPTGTVFVRHQLVFRQLENAAGAVYFDDLELQPPPPTPTAVNVTAVQGAKALHLSFGTVPGFHYQIQFIEGVTNRSWTVMTNIAGDGEVKLISETADLATRFYRVLRSCE